MEQNLILFHCRDVALEAQNLSHLPWLNSQPGESLPQGPEAQVPDQRQHALSAEVSALGSVGRTGPEQRLVSLTEA